MARRERTELSEEDKALVDKFRQERKARNLRALGQGVSGLGRTMRGGPADIDEGFIRGGLEGEDAWMTSEEKRKELQPLELAMREEDFKRDQMELQQRMALMGFMQNAYNEAARRADAQADRELRAAIANQQARMQAAGRRTTARSDTRNGMQGVAERAAAEAEAIEAGVAMDAYHDAITANGMHIVTSSKEYREGRIYDAPVVSTKAVEAAEDAHKDEQALNPDIPDMDQDTAVNVAAENSRRILVNEAGYGVETELFQLQAADLGRRAREEAAEGRASHQTNGIDMAVQAHHGVEGASVERLSSEERVELNMALADSPLRGAQPSLADDDLANWERTRDRATSTTGAAVLSSRRLIEANPKAFDPTATAQIQEAHRLLGYTVEKSAEEAITAAQVQAGREGVAEAPAAEPPGGAEPEESWLGMPGMKKPSDPREASLQAIELIEQFPELPPLQEAKKQLMESTQFTQYKTKLGYEDDKVALRQMVKDARAMDKEKRKTTRRAIKENQELGLTPKEEAPLVKRKPPEVEAPVDTGEL